MGTAQNGVEDPGALRGRKHAIDVDPLDQLGPDPQDAADAVQAARGDVGGLRAPATRDLDQLGDVLGDQADGDVVALVAGAGDDDSGAQTVGLGGGGSEARGEIDNGQDGAASVKQAGEVGAGSGERPKRDAGHDLIDAIGFQSQAGRADGDEENKHGG
jgi:hypothetical protein